MTTFQGQFSITRVLTILMAFAGINLASAQPDNGTANMPDNVGTGAWPAMKEEVNTLPDHVIYRPQNIAAMGNTKLGVVAWGNGGCSTDGASTRFHLLELASHGYLVIASGRIYSGPGAHEREPVPEGQQPQRTVYQQLTAAVDWAMVENARVGSPYYGRIDPDMIAMSGFSCGGLEAVQAGGDPRVDTLVLHNTGVVIDNSGAPAIAAMAATKDLLEDFHTPVIYILGGESDIAYVNGMDDYARINHVPAAVANLDVGHGGTYFEENGGQAAQVAVHWLEWQLRGDQEAAKWFVGDDCVLCTDDEWTLEMKNFD